MVNVAIVGCGNISKFHVRGYQEFPEKCRIVALCDIIPEKMDQTDAIFSLGNPRKFDDHQEMLAQMAGEIDLVSVCTPPFCHAEIAINSLRAGCATLVEKPMAASLEECDEMLRAQKESGSLLSSIAQNRFRGPVQRLKKALDSNLIGRVLHAQVDSHWWRGHSYYDLWWRGRWDKEGGGCTLNHAVHHIDMLLWMMGLPEKVTAVISNAGHDNSEVEDISIAALRYPKGTLAQITSSVIHHGERQQLIFQGEKARISFPWETVASVPAPSGFPIPDHELEAKINAFEAELKHEGHTAQIEDVIDAIVEGREPKVTGYDGRASIELITAIYQSGSLDQTVALPLGKDAPFYTVEGILEHAPRFFKKTTSLEELGSEGIKVDEYKY
ncbi:MAG: Gfo/Idh/MocA family oxidoreductase [Clostridiales bacterium]|jgi:predicted dehydrogenase|nr:Gfo/Idh/MocA family oxidoreductase [Clostridiales bacterium]